MKNRIEFWLKDNNGTYLRLPVNPESVTISSPYSINTVNIASLGEVSIAGGRGLKSVNFDSFFPAKYNPSYCEYSGFPAPFTWVNRIEKWRDSRSELRLVLTGTQITIPVYISEFEIEPERAGSPGDIYYSLGFTEYKSPTVRIVKAVKSVTTPVKSVSKTRPKPPAKKKPKTYTVVRGDSLWKIAAKPSVYGKGSDWSKLYNKNKKVVGKNPNLIYPGQKLVIP